MINIQSGRQPWLRVQFDQTMGQEQCKCLRETKTEPAHEESINHRELEEKIHSARFRINTISKPLSAQRTAHASHQNSKTKRNISLVFKGVKPDFTLKFDIVEPDVNEKIFFLGSEQDIPINNRIKKVCEDDRFKITVKYVGNTFGGGVFYVKDDAIGLGCFYKLPKDTKVELKNNMIIMLGNEFLVSSTNQNSILTTSQTSDMSEDASMNQTLLNFHGGSIPQGQVVGLALQNQQKVRIGRLPPCDVVLNDPLLSSTHCTIAKQDSRWMLSDGNEHEPSTTGTWIYLSHTTQITNGMQFRCGSTHFTAEIRK